jgi:hypothetical protein
MPISVSNGESGLSVRNKINGSLGVESGALADPYQLTFDIYHRIRTLTVNADIEIGLGSAMVSNTFETLITTGDGSHELTFDPDIQLLGDSFNPDKVQCIDFRYIAGSVLAVIQTLGDVEFVPVLTAAVVNTADSNVLNLTFDVAVNFTTTGWSLSATGGAVTLSSVASGSGTTEIRVYLSRVIANGETVTISYNPATGSTVATTGGVEVGTISAQSVTNNVAAAGSTLLSDNFNDASLDLAKWDVTNPADGVTISETTALNFAGNPASAVASANSNHIDSDLSFNNAVNVFRCTLLRNAQCVNQTVIFKIYNASDTYATARQIQITKTIPGGKIQERGYNGSTFSYDPGATAIDWLTTGVPVKIVKTGTNIKLYYHDGTAWVNLSDHTFDLGGAVKVTFAANSSASDTGTPTVSFDDLYVTDYDYGSLTP